MKEPSPRFQWGPRGGWLFWLPEGTGLAIQRIPLWPKQQLGKAKMGGGSFPVTGRRPQSGLGRKRPGTGGCRGGGHLEGQGVRGAEVNCTWFLMKRGNVASRLGRHSGRKTGWSKKEDGDETRTMDTKKEECVSLGVSPGLGRDPAVCAQASLFIPGRIREEIECGVTRAKMRGNPSFCARSQKNQFGPGNCRLPFIGSRPRIKVRGRDQGDQMAPMGNHVPRGQQPKKFL